MPYAFNGSLQLFHAETQASARNPGILEDSAILYGLGVLALSWEKLQDRVGRACWLP